MNSFLHWFVIIISVGSFLGCIWLIWGTSKKTPGETDEGETTGHTCIQSLDSRLQPLTGALASDAKHRLVMSDSTVAHSPLQHTQKIGIRHLDDSHRPTFARIVNCRLCAWLSHHIASFQRKHLPDLRPRVPQDAEQQFMPPVTRTPDKPCHLGSQQILYVLRVRCHRSCSMLLPVPPVN